MLNVAVHCVQAGKMGGDRRILAVIYPVLGF